MVTVGRPWLGYKPRRNSERCKTADTTPSVEERVLLLSAKPNKNGGWLLVMHSKNDRYFLASISLPFCDELTTHPLDF
jgi:hypothetical protein